MDAIRPRIHTALRGLVSACPPDCRPAGWACVQLALLMLPSSSLIAGVLLLIAITSQRPLRQPAPLSRPQAPWLLLLSALMVLGSTWAVGGADAWWKLFNWLPFFWLYLAIQPYLVSCDSRRRLGQWILAGTVPVIAVTLAHRITGSTQLLETCWGLIRWPMGDPARGAGMFDNPNVTGAWLAITMPFLVAACLAHRQALRERMGALGITIASTVAMVIASSRNALAPVPLIWALSCGRRGRIAVLVACLGYSSLVLLKAHLGPGSALAPLLDLIVPETLIQKLQEMGSGTADELKYARRPAIFAAALGYVARSPWVGYGENGFVQIYFNDLVQQLNGLEPVRGGILHSHNLWLEFAVSHGVPALLLLLAVFGRSLSQATPLLWRRSQGLDRAWVLATLVMLWMHLWDLPSFDARVNVLDWLLMAGITCIAGSLTANPPAALREEAQAHCKQPTG